MTARPALATAAPRSTARRRVALAAFVAVALAAPALLVAQITTGLTPPLPPPSDSQVAAAESVVTFTRDSIAQAERLSMQAWVDSAARSLERGAPAVVPLPGAPGDTLLPDAGTPPTPAAPPSAGAPVPPVSQPAPRPATPPASPPAVPPDSGRAPPPRDSVGGRDGAGLAAPDTASPLPLLALAGLALSGLGLGLLRRR